MSDPNSWLPLLSLVVAIAAVIFGPIISRSVARAQVKSDSRQNWLDTVRTKIARFILLSTIVQENISINKLAKPEVIDEIRALVFEFQLYLNPKKDLQKKLLYDIAVVNNASSEVDFKVFGDALVELTKDSQNLVNEVWLKIKKGH